LTSDFARLLENKTKQNKIAHTLPGTWKLFFPHKFGV
jgi:hypothetical protein